MARSKLLSWRYALPLLAVLFAIGVYHGISRSQRQGLHPRSASAVNSLQPLGDKGSELEGSAAPEESRTPLSNSNGSIDTLPKLTWDEWAKGSIDDASSVEVVVHAIASETNAPLSGLRTVATRANVGVEDVVPSLHMLTDAHSGNMILCPLTDRDGFSRLRLPLGETLRIRVFDESERIGAGEVALELLDKNGIKSIEIRIPTSNSLVVAGRIEDEETKAPISHARISLEKLNSALVPREAVAEAPSNADGSFEVYGPPWLAVQGRVSADGYADKVFNLNYSISKDIGVIQLHKGAEVVGHVIRTLNHGAGRLSVVLYSPQGNGQWSNEISADGSFRISGVEPYVPLNVTLKSSDHSWHPLSTPIVLNPGEIRKLVLQVRAATIDGRIAFSDGSPIAGQEIWLLPGGNPNPKGLSVLSDERQVLERDVSEEEGRFSFSSVPPGKYIVSPAAPTPGKIQGTVVPAAEFIDIQSDAVYSIMLSIPLPMYIEGRVVSSGGLPIPEAWVFATSIDRVDSSSVQATIGGDFRVGPLLAGSYVLRGMDQLNGYVSTGEYVATAGSSGVVLELGHASRLVGEVRTSPGTDSYWVRIGPSAGHKGYQMSTRANAEGRFEFGAVPSGTYFVYVWNSERSCGYKSNVVVSNDIGRTEVLIEPETGCKLHLQGGEGLSAVDWTVLVNGDALASGVLAAGQHQTVVIPPGLFSVSCGDDLGVPHLYEDVIAEPATNVSMTLPLN